MAITGLPFIYLYPFWGSSQVSLLCFERKFTASRR